MDAGPATCGAAAHVLVPDLADELSVDGADGHHLARVRRLRVGERVSAADGAGAWREFVVAAVADRVLELRADGPTQHAPRPDPQVAVAFAITKGSKPDVVVRQLTELGVDRLAPVVGSRSVARPRAERVGSVTERLCRVAREAAMQSRRAWLPAVDAPVPLVDLAGTDGLVVAELGAPTARDLAAPGPQGWTLVVGPEGGLTTEEVRALAPAGRLGLGPHVLRAETAAVAGAALLIHLRQIGDFPE